MHFNLFIYKFDCENRIEIKKLLIYETNSQIVQNCKWKILIRLNNDLKNLKLSNTNLLIIY